MMEQPVLQGIATTISKRKRRGWKDLFHGERIGYLYILPSLVFLLAVMGFPIVYSIYMSFQTYVTVFNNPVFWIAASHSIIFTTLSIVFQFTIGFALALLFSRSFPF